RVVVVAPSGPTGLVRYEGGERVIVVQADMRSNGVRREDERKDVRDERRRDGSRSRRRRRAGRIGTEHGHPLSLDEVMLEGEWNLEARPVEPSSELCVHATAFGGTSSPRRASER